MPERNLSTTMSEILDNISAISSVVIAISQLAFVIFFVFFARGVKALRDDVGTIIAFLVTADERLNAALKAAKDNSQSLGNVHKRQDTIGLIAKAAHRKNVELHQETHNKIEEVANLFSGNGAPAASGQQKLQPPTPPSSTP